MTVGRIFKGEFDEIYVRQKEGKEIEIGDLLVAEKKDEYSILQAFNLFYGSQIPEKVKTLMAGMKLEGYGKDLEFTDPEISNYITAKLKNLVTVNKESNKAVSPKKLPQFFSELRRIQEKDLEFLESEEKKKNQLRIGKIRSGSKTLEADVQLPGEETLRHHVLIPASTGKGKSNLVKVIAYELLDKDYCGFLVLDPHDEYYGKTSKGLSDHPKADKKLEMYSTNPPPGENTLVVHLSQLKPRNLTEVMDLSDAQNEALYAYHNKDKKKWLENLVKEDMKDIGEDEFKGEVQAKTISVLQRKIRAYLGIEENNGRLSCRSIFKTQAGESTIRNIVNSLENGKTVVIDTSNLENKVELLVGSMIAGRAFSKYRNYKGRGELSEKPVISIVLEEAPRVIGVNSSIRSGNTFEKIAREGRKFKIGLTAITQLPSVIPKEILANMNTKIILGTEMDTERKSLVESAPQDLSKDDKSIASLDIGEAVVTSTFTKFAVPTTIPLFENIVDEKQKEKTQKSYTGLEME